MRIPLYRGRRATGLATIEIGNTLAGLPVIETWVQTAALDGFGLLPQFIKIDVEGHELAVLRGAAETLERNHPAILVEAEERHRPGAVASVADFLRHLGYHGRFPWRREWLPIEQFEPTVHQSPDVPDALGRMNGGYAGMFVFRPLC
ncbi:MAG: FkbM family methyltransferase [Acetobacteraceae bacterium]